MQARCPLLEATGPGMPPLQPSFLGKDFTQHPSPPPTPRPTLGFTQLPDVPFEYPEGLSLGKPLCVSHRLHQCGGVLGLFVPYLVPRA